LPSKLRRCAPGADRSKAFSCLVELAATEQDPKLRRKASALLESWLREAGLDIVRRSAEQPGAKQI